jgi:hypothetical protein
MILSFENSRRLKEAGYAKESKLYYQYSLNKAVDPETNKTEGAFGWKKGELSRQSGFFINNWEKTDYSSKSWYMCSAPILHDVQDWLIERGIHFYIAPVDENHDGSIEYVWCIFKKETSTKSYKNREEAIEEGIKEVFKYL